MTAEGGESRGAAPPWPCGAYDYDLEGRGEDPQISSTAKPSEGDGLENQYTDPASPDATSSTDSGSTDSTGSTSPSTLSLSDLISHPGNPGGNGHHFGWLHHWTDPCFGHKNKHDTNENWGGNQRDCYRTPAEEGVGNVIYRFNTYKFTDYYYNWQDRIERVVTRTYGKTYKAEYTYQDNGMRFQKTSDTDGRLSDTFYFTPDYRIHTDHNHRQDIHSVEVRAGNTLIARMQFNHPTHYLAAGPGLYTDRALDALHRLLHLQGGIHSAPTHIAAMNTAMGRAISLALPHSTREVPWRALFELLVITLAITGAILLLRIWATEDRKTHRILPSRLQRIMALAMLTSFFPLATGCFNGLASKDGDFKDGAAFSLLALLGLSSSDTSTTDGYDPASDPDPVTTTTGGIPVSYRPGTNFYISFENGSTDIVTDQNGHVTARFAYEPFGRLNPHASDLDVDGDHHSYTGGFLYTGQEYELETDTYDYHARTYDAQTGRFLQADPVFTARAGYDSYDPYQYVNDDPVNQVDPSGKSWLSAYSNSVQSKNLTIMDRLTGGAKLFAKAGNWKNFTAANGGGEIYWASKGISGGFNNMGSLAGQAGTNIGNGAKWLASGGTYRNHEGDFSFSGKMNLGSVDIFGADLNFAASFSGRIPSLNNWMSGIHDRLQSQLLPPDWTIGWHMGSYDFMGASMSLDASFNLRSIGTELRDIGTGLVYAGIIGAGIAGLAYGCSLYCTAGYAAYTAISATTAYTVGNMAFGEFLTKRRVNAALRERDKQDMYEMYFFLYLAAKNQGVSINY